MLTADLEHQDLLTVGTPVCNYEETRGNQEARFGTVQTDHTKVVAFLVVRPHEGDLSAVAGRLGPPNVAGIAAGAVIGQPASLASRCMARRRFQIMCIASYPAMARRAASIL